jgi:fatty acid desaturase
MFHSLKIRGYKKGSTMKGKNIFYLKFLIYFMFTAIGFGLMSAEAGGYALAGIALHGVFNAHGIQLLHQASHYRAFRNRIINDLAGVVLGINALIPFHQYRRKHNEHHAHLGTSSDSEVFGFEKIGHESSLSIILKSFFNLSLIKLILTNLKGFRIQRNWSELSVPIFMISFLVICILTSSVSIFVFWIASNIIVTGPIHFLIEIPEHYGCDKLSLDKTKNTRSIISPSLFVKWFTNWNNYHSEHHMFPKVLPEELHKFSPKNRTINKKECMNDYFEFYAFYLKTTFRGIK